MTSSKSSISVIGCPPQHQPRMARHPIINTSPRDIAAIDLDKALSRLERKLLSPDADSKLQHSSYERKRTSSVSLPSTWPPLPITHILQVLEYARTLLIRLEQDTQQRNAPLTSKQDSKASLSKQRALLKRLTDRLHEIEQSSRDDDTILGPEDGEPIFLADPALKPAASTTTTSATSTTNPPPSHRPPSPTQAGLRNRFAPTQTSSSPFATATATTTDEKDTSLATRLQSADSERAAITSSLVSLAQQLKKSNIDMHDSLTADNEVMKRAGEGLDKNESGMEAAGKRMSMLSRMSEGQGWWGRMMLYAWIFGLWIGLILFVFVGPKLRF